jgi:hypothetical protein
MAVTLVDGHLHVELQPTFEEVYEPDFLPDMLCRFVAFDPGHRVFGWVHLDADRLTDLLNSCEALHLEDVEIANLEDGSQSSSDEIVIGRQELIAVHASGPKGDVTQRRATRPHAVTIQAGNYRIAGLLHVPDDADPMASILDRPPMIPLTEACLEYWSGDERKHRITGTIIVNRDRADWIRATA